MLSVDTYGCCCFTGVCGPAELSGRPLLLFYSPVMYCCAVCLFIVCVCVSCLVRCGLWSVVCGLWPVVCGLWSAVCGLWSAVCGLWSDFYFVIRKRVLLSAIRSWKPWGWSTRRNLLWFLRCATRGAAFQQQRLVAQHRTLGMRSCNESVNGSRTTSHQRTLPHTVPLL